MKRLSVTLALLLALRTGPARANARQFAYTYESAVLPAAARELELSTTWRVGRDTAYSRLEHRAELEYGVTDRLLASVYLNWSKTSERDPLGTGLISAATSDGISSEWKYKITDAAADPVGLAGYAEFTFDSDEVEPEVKLIADKVVGPLKLAYNAVLEPEFGYDAGAFKAEQVGLEHDLGVSFAASPALTCGAEIRQPSLLEDGKMTHAALFAGPVLHLAAGEFWITATTLFQLPALKRPATNLPGHRYDLDEFEKVNARVLVSLPF